MKNCDICGTVILGGYENEGGFPAPEGFTSHARTGKNKITDTCNPCGYTIRHKVDEAVKDAVRTAVESLRGMK
jgi:hypothetical protein